MLSLPQLAASIKGVNPLAVAALTSTPASSRRFTMLSWPIYEAYISGVQPPMFLPSRSTSRLRQNQHNEGVRGVAFQAPCEDPHPRAERRLLFDALCHDIVLADGAGGVQVQRHVQLFGPHQGVAEPHGQAGTQLLRLTGFVAQLGHFSTFRR